MRVPVFCVLLLAAGTAFAQAGSAPKSAPSHKVPATKPVGTEANKEADIRRLLALTGTRDMVNQMKSSMMVQFRRNGPVMPQEMLDEIMNELKAEDLEESMIPVYSKHFSSEDIKHLIAFYQSPFGKKLLREMPQIMSESNEVGMQWGEGVVTRVATRWRDQGKITQRAYDQLTGAAGAEEGH